MSELEDLIGVDLKEIDGIDFTEKDEKENKQCLDFYTSCQTMSENSSKKMNDISDGFDKIVAKIKPLLIPDENEWKTWTARDFQKFVFFVKLCLFLFNLNCPGGSRIWISNGKLRISK